ncbi:MAG TPA: M48 family metallopeptidase, partial [Sedimentisphaerales bacterium]|nr:M48 family metallopeptidase [Sedimentisphaerales bacterium]
MSKSRLYILPAIFVSCLVCGCAINPITGRSELNLFTVSDDITLGQKYAPEVEKQLGGAIPNQELQNYINSVGQRVAAVAHTPQFTYRFVAVNDKMMNAFALPGGHIFITRGLLAKLTTEAQLAAVLAHEVAHVAARHSTHQMSRQIGLEILLGAASRGGAGEGAMTVASLAGQLITLRYSRGQEKEADIGGIDLMIAAGYSPWGMAETMKMIEAHSAGSVEWLSRHPSPGNRVGYITETIQSRHLPMNLIVNAEAYKRH